MKIFKMLFVFALMVNFTIANTVFIKDLNDQNISINQNSYSIIEFDKMIENVKVSDKNSIDIDFNEYESSPLKSVKLFGKKVGNSNLLVTFIDSTTVHINVNVVRDLFKIINIAQTISPNLIVKQANNKVILDGTVQNKKVKNKILNLFEKSGVNLKADLVDLVELESPDKMVKLKLYAVEINNSDDLDLKNTWEFLQNSSSSNLQNVNITTGGITNNSVTLSGGLAVAADILGSAFNTSLTLQYLSSKGYANVLDETTLLTLENQKANFLAGGTIYIKVATTTAQGVPTTEIRDVDYGLQLDIKAENIVGDKYVSLNVVTKSSDVDWTQTVDGIPFFTEKSIQTNVVVGNRSTIILGGLTSSNNSENIDKIPVLGDIPLLGKLFTSKSFREGKSELVFFITPEIVNPENTNEINKLKQKTQFSKELDHKFKNK